MNEYFENIKNDSGTLLNFFNIMPKGAEIHHHALGALDVEDILEYAVENNLWIDLNNGQLYKDSFLGREQAKIVSQSEDLRNFCFSQWSTSAFIGSKKDAAAHFFNIFQKILPVFRNNETYWLEKICKKASNEGLLYIETLIEHPDSSEVVWGWALDYEGNLENDEDFEKFYHFIKRKGLEEVLNQLFTTVETWKKINQHGIELLFQLYTVRNLDIRQVFAQMILSYEAAYHSEHIVGVNLVAPEFHENTLKFYSIQMKMCRWLNSIFKGVNLALHAGELTDELVSEKYLKFHIQEALFTASAKRIGHGVDLLYETHRNGILDFMQEKDIAIEILSDSNDFILGVRGISHPFEIYHKMSVPIVLSTDDPGILQCTLAEQYYKIASENNYLRYEHFRQFSVNSLKYSFLPTSKKEVLLTKLENQLSKFENNYTY